LRVARYVLRVAGYGLRVTRCGLRVDGKRAERMGHSVEDIDQKKIDLGCLYYLVTNEYFRLNIEGILSI
jgi:hypothetical protein